MNRVPGLDLLRAIAILWVMLSHGQMLGLISGDNFVARFGWMGVDLFFALSGFLICGQLFRAMVEGHPADAGRFYMRRAFRTLPAYAVVVALYFLVPGWREFPDIQPAWQFLTFTENLFFVPGHLKSFSHVWSLCVEEQFYLVAPAVVWMLGRKSFGRRALAVAIILMVGGMALRGVIWLHVVGPLKGVEPSSAYWHAWIQHIYYPSWNRLDGLVAGAVFAFIAAFKPGLWAILTRRGDWLLTAGLTGLAVGIWLFGVQADFLPSVIGYPLVSFSMALMVVAGASTTSLIGRFAVPGAGLLAAASYSLYLSHKAALHLVKAGLGDALADRPLLAVLAYCGAVVVVGAVLHLLVERPFLRLRDRMMKSHRQPLPPAVEDAATA